MGPKLRDADVPQRFEFDDVDLVVNIRAARAARRATSYWEWTDDVAWEPKVKMTMSSETPTSYFQGKENVAMAIARRRIKTGGDVKAALALIPITKPIYAQLPRARRASTRTSRSERNAVVDRRRPGVDQRSQDGISTGGRL